MRGLRHRPHSPHRRRRYNPAYAGTTAPHHVPDPVRPIQPRVCGDYKIPHQKRTLDKDTTPRMRGLLQPAFCVPLPVRYNPAYAGTTHRTPSGHHRTPIQPRVCGDYLPSSLISLICRDTTPRMRGLLFLLLLLAFPFRYNPAYAGTTCMSPCISLIVAIQPRVCGDYEIIGAL